MQNELKEHLERLRTIALSSGPSSRASTPGRILASSSSRRRRRQEQAQDSDNLGRSSPRNDVEGLNNDLETRNTQPTTLEDQPAPAHTPLPAAAESPQPAQSDIRPRGREQAGMRKVRMAAGHKVHGDGVPGDGVSGEEGRVDANQRRAAAARQAQSVSPVQRRLGRPERHQAAKSLELGGGQRRGLVGGLSSEDVQRGAKQVCSQQEPEKTRRAGNDQGCDAV